MTNHQSIVFAVFIVISSARVMTAQGFRQGARFAIEACTANLLVLMLINGGGKW